MSSCEAWIQFVTPSDVKALKVRLNPYFLALDAGVAQCPTIDQGTRAAWTAFAASWRDYFAKEEHFLSAGSEFNTGCEYESAIANWQRTVGACAIGGPTLPDRAVASDAGGGDTSTKRTVRTVAIAAGVVAAAFVIRGVMR